ncbi:hypothetical protein EPUL_005214, partial [Erysiphe pulchra]
MAETFLTIDTIEERLADLRQKNTNNEIFGLVDMGSNGIRFSISDLRPPLTRLLTPVFHERASISLYDALHESGPDARQFHFSERTIKKVSDTLCRFKAIGTAYGVPEVHFIIFATEAFRTAKNKDQMLEAIQRSTGFTVYILSHEVETLFGSMGVRSGFAEFNGLVMDMGGGSLQVTYVNNSIGSNYETLAARAGQCLPFGAARLMDELSNPNTAQVVLAELQARMNITIQNLVDVFIHLRSQVESVEGVNIYLCGGGFRGYGSMLMHTDPIQPYPIPSIGGYLVSASYFKNWQDMLIMNDQAGDVFGLSKRRRHQLPAVAMVVQAITMAVPRIKSIIFCTGGNREGLLFMMLPPNIREMDPFPLIPVPNPQQDPQILMHVTDLLMATLPSELLLPPVIFARKIVSYISCYIWAYQGRKGNASCFLHKIIGEIKTALPSLPHFLCAVLAITLSARWGNEFGPMDSMIVKNLQKVIGLETVWWCRYIGTACRFISLVCPVFPQNLESFKNVLRWKVTVSDSLGKGKKERGILIQVYLLSGSEKGIPGGLDGPLKKMWKHIGKGLALDRIVNVNIELIECQHLVALHKPDPVRALLHSTKLYGGRLGDELHINEINLNRQLVKAEIAASSETTEISQQHDNFMYPLEMSLLRARIKNLAFYNLDDYLGFLTRSVRSRQRCIIQNQKFSSNYSASSASTDDTIYALSTAPGRGALAIVRASGPQSKAIFNSLCPYSLDPHPRKAIVRRLYNPINSKIVVDSAAVILYYTGPSSATGEDVLEMHIHGGSATQKAVLAAISDVASSTKLPIRYAEPGEFTKRAFLNHKLELAQVEALSNELSAETEQQRQAAVRGNPRMLSKIYENWRNKLLLARGEIEALIDFSEDQNFEESPQKLLGNVRNYVDLILAEIKRLNHASFRQELLKRGVKVSLLGPPNSGKSSLLNRIIGREASIVSEEAGTTRDVIEISLDIKGYLCTFADTAGLRDESTSSGSLNNKIGAVEQEGIRRAKYMAKKSDIVIFMASFEHKDSSEMCIIKYDQSSLFLTANASNALIVVNKCDKVVSSDQLKSLLEDFQIKVTSAFSPRMPPPVIPICCHDNPGLDEFKKNDDNIEFLLSKLLEVIERLTEFPVEVEDLIGVTERQRLILEKFGSHLQDFRKEMDIVLAAEQLRLAANCISRITGRGEEGDIEELLGVIFE